MARPKKPDNELTRPRTLKTPDGKSVLRKGRPPKSGVTVQLPVAELKQILGSTTTQLLPSDTDIEMTNYTPLEYVLHVMNDPRQPAERRDRLAVAALPFMHTKKGEGGKREKAVENANKAATSGKFATPSAPKLVAVGK